MNEYGNLWAVGFEDAARAEEARATVRRLQEGHHLLLPDVAVVLRRPDGSFQVERESNPSLLVLGGLTLAGFLAGLVVLQPLAGAALGAVAGGAGAAVASGIGIDETFLLDVGGLIKPGTAALFLLCNASDMDVLLYQIRGLGGTVLKTTVDVERARKIQEALNSPVAGQQENPK